MGALKAVAADKLGIGSAHSLEIVLGVVLAQEMVYTVHTDYQEEEDILGHILVLKDADIQAEHLALDLRNLGDFQDGCLGDCLGDFQGGCPVEGKLRMAGNMAVLRDTVLGVDIHLEILVDTDLVGRPDDTLEHHW